MPPAVSPVSSEALWHCRDFRDFTLPCNNFRQPSHRTRPYIMSSGKRHMCFLGLPCFRFVTPALHNQWVLLVSLFPKQVLGEIHCTSSGHLRKSFHHSHFGSCNPCCFHHSLMALKNDFTISLAFTHFHGGTGLPSTNTCHPEVNISCIYS